MLILELKSKKGKMVLGEKDTKPQQSIKLKELQKNFSIEYEPKIQDNEEIFLFFCTSLNPGPCWKIVNMSHNLKHNNKKIPWKKTFQINNNDELVIIGIKFQVLIY